MIGFIQDQTNWYNEKTNKINSVRFKIATELGRKKLNLGGDTFENLRQAFINLGLAMAKFSGIKTKHEQI